MVAVAYAGFSKGGAEKFRKFENNEDQNKNFSTSRFSCPKSGEDQKKRRSSLRFSPVFGPKLGEGQKKRSSPTVCVLKPCPSYKGAILRRLFYANYTILATQRGGHGPMPPLNTPLDGRLWFFFVCLIRSSS